VASSWESWVRSRARAVRADGHGRECVRGSRACWGSIRVRPSIASADMPMREARCMSRGVSLGSSRRRPEDKNRTDLPPDSRCRPLSRHQWHPATVLQGRPREGTFDAGLELRTTRDSDCLRCFPTRGYPRGTDESDAIAGITWSRFVRARSSRPTSSSSTMGSATH